MRIRAEKMRASSYTLYSDFFYDFISGYPEGGRTSQRGVKNKESQEEEEKGANGRGRGRRRPHRLRIELPLKKEGELASFS